MILCDSYKSFKIIIINVITFTSVQKVSVMAATKHLPTTLRMIPALQREHMAMARSSGAYRQPCLAAIGPN